MKSQSTHNILMIRPANFGFNPETAEDNAFQKEPNAENVKHIHTKAVQEFDNFVKKLCDAEISVIVIQDTLEPHTPDSIFPNNWISFHEEGNTYCLYPMAASNRRLERKSHVLNQIKSKFHTDNYQDFTAYEKEGKYLEGTGSMVLDRQNKIAYACLSDRTDKNLFETFCKKMGYKPISFVSVDENNSKIYHTNVMLCVANNYTVGCFDSIPNQVERETVLKSLEQTGKIVIKITYKQMNSFAGNMLQVKNSLGKTFLVMSSTAYNSFDFEQISQIEKFDNILHSDLTTIETHGGGSARCMMAEIFLQERV